MKSAIDATDSIVMLSEREHVALIQISADPSAGRDGGIDFEILAGMGERGLVVVRDVPMPRTATSAGFPPPPPQVHQITDLGRLALAERPIRRAAGDLTADEMAAIVNNMRAIRREDPAAPPSGGAAVRGSSAGVAIVNLVTALGLGLGLTGVALLSPVLLLLSSVCDAVDGFAARRLSADTLVGAKFDWAVDTALSYAIVYRVVGHWPILAVACVAALVVTQSTASYFARRCSGRTVATLLAVAWIWWPA